MKRKVSEFAYGFVLTHELRRSYGYLPTDVPLPGTEKKRRKAKAQSDVDTTPRGYALFLQFKASEFMKRKNDYYLQFIREITARDLLPGAKELLEEIRAAGLKIALGSASELEYHSLLAHVK